MYKIILLLVFVISIFSSCNYASAILMSIPDKKNEPSWKSNGYKVLVQRRQGWAGPAYYRIKIKKRIGFLYFINSENFISTNTYAKCIFKISTKRDSLAIDVCNKKIN